MFALLRKEIDSFLNSLIGYVVILVFLLSIGLFLWIFPGTEFNLLENGYANLDSLFILSPWMFLFLIPAITMRMFAEENKSGTIELLLTRPLSDLQIVLAKYGAAVILVLFSIVPTFVYYISVYKFASPSGNIDTAGISGSYIGLIFLCSGFASIGIFTSSLTNNQIIAFILSVLLCFFFYSGFDFISSMMSTGPVGILLSQFGMSNHYASLSRGVIDTRDLVYFLSLSSFFILLSKFNLEKRKW
ncbi:MAG: gliding motility-associated ABC transporter permease subunit GldF [Bacteroidetes bacterium]|nr:gliding motility-associated ABC transporter permease subunit GldF [Bacteroidota bacterium]MBP6401567.1 gliding motility-associated ABC transporter permease subunit GldF [Bacteroidia bacterium]MBK9526543.1 gliding motility-associated ABC transporter permease subunit GldF [Bacteroidota bacterium]MBK9542630.1 gliding motility-associated ABC transporter permease subunit GldF [Bacteroidota bacterium]MBL0256962.1 gliding motility-associated ABC transporter permease subunit GldF [Bacteroidota bacte